MTTANWQTYRVGHGALIENGCLLLAGNAWPQHNALIWTLPGGRCEEGEPAVAAVVREFREETGLAVTVGPLIYVAESQSQRLRTHYLTCAFAVSRQGGDLSCADDPAVRAVQFVPLTDLGTYLPTPSLGDPIRYWITHPTAPLRYWYFPEYSSQ